MNNFSRPYFVYRINYTKNANVENYQFSGVYPIHNNNNNKDIVLLLIKTPQLNEVIYFYGY